MSALRSQLVEQHVPDELAVRIASLEELHSALDLVEVAMSGARADCLRGAGIFRSRRAHRAHLDQGANRKSLPADGHWQAVARGTLRENLYALQARITLAVLKYKGREPAARVGSMAVASFRAGRFAEAGGGRSAHGFAAGFRDDVSGTASGQTPCPALTQDAARPVRSVRTICSSASIGKSCWQSPWG